LSCVSSIKSQTFFFFYYLWHNSKSYGGEEKGKGSRLKESENRILQKCGGMGFIWLS